MEQSETISSRSGGCLCGGVRYEVTATNAVLQCHCENCRPLSGNYVAAVRGSTSDLSLADPEGLYASYDLGYAAYTFCGRCGSRLFFLAADTPEIVSVMVGTLDDSSDLWVKQVWFADEAQPHNTLPDVPRFRGNG